MPMPGFCHFYTGLFFTILNNTNHRNICSGGLLLLSSVLIVYFRPSAAGSGLPELIGFLNGTFLRRIFNLKTFLAKFVSCFLSVGCGMPVGPEGPMIHLGSIIGASLSQFQPLPASWLPWFNRCSPSCC